VREKQRGPREGETKVRHIERTEDEIAEVENRAAESAGKGRSVYPGMSYEEGIDAVLRWLFNPDEDPPFEED